MTLGKCLKTVDNCFPITHGERDDKAAVGELEAATARRLDRWTDEVCGKGALCGDGRMGP